MMRDGKLSRRQLLRAGGAGVAVVSVVGCDVLATDPEGTDGAERDRAKGAEAPVLADRVKAGDLPRLEERLPDSPLVVDPVDRIGTYGGTWRTALLGVADDPWLRRTIGYDDLMRWDPEWTGSVPNVAESVEQSEDGREFTITLRSGIKWSDGTPMTADDLVFAWDDVIMNVDVTPVPPIYLMSAGEPGTIEKVDDRTVRVSFAAPAGLLTLYLAYVASTLAQSPRHYLSDFLPAYNSDVEALAEEEGYGSWPELFLAKADVWENKDIPRLHPWILTAELGSGERVVAERNPYYFKTDPDGSQLPYIDEVIYDVISDVEVILLKATNGEIDFHTRHFNTPPNKPVLAQGREQGGFDFTALVPAFDNEMVIALNLAHKDPVKREIFQNRDFRIGLSYAINRQELIDVVYQSQGEPWQVAPRPESDYFDEEFAKQYVEFDVDKANEHLDLAGYDQRDGDGFRRGPDGKRISFAVEVATPAVVPFWTDAMELIADKYWHAVGIDAQIKTEDRSLFYERKEANLHDAGIWTDSGGLTLDIVLDPRWFFPFSLESVWATSWSTYFTSRGESGDEPLGPAKEQMELYWQLQETADEEGRAELFREILRIAKEEFYVIGTVMAKEYYGILRNNFHNVPESMPESHIYNTPAGSQPEQYFIE